MGDERVAVVGLGYVGLPLAVAFAESSAVASVVGFDIHQGRVDGLQAGQDVTGEVDNAKLVALIESGRLRVSSDPADLNQATAFIVTVPTPITEENVPDLSAVRAAATVVGGALSSGGLVVLESTVYPGVTEEVFAPEIEARSGLACGTGWSLGYSPERINPGDRTHTIDRVIKIVAGDTAATLDRVSRLYESVCHAGVHHAASIAVAETAKVFENIQRDLGIAAVNELALVCHRLGISVHDVLSAAGTKWNFIPYQPGLVGGHCIGVDPYYLAHRAKQLGYHPDVLLAGRRVNDAMPIHIADQMLEGLILAGKAVHGARVLVLGCTFKPNVPDTRNAKVRDVIRKLQHLGVEVVAHDPMLTEQIINDGFGVENIVNVEMLDPVDGVLVATLHEAFQAFTSEKFQRLVRPPGVVVDVSGFFRDRLQGVEGVDYRTL
jgi:UDP-N-acetyl-D-glucosamine/UDP-N-acetyl-D-galactosamine dehydrogenase